MKRTKQKKPSEQRLPIALQSVPVQTLGASTKMYFAFRSVDYHFRQDYNRYFLGCERASDAIGNAVSSAENFADRESKSPLRVQKTAVSFSFARTTTHLSNREIDFRDRLKSLKSTATVPMWRNGRRNGLKIVRTAISGLCAIDQI